MLADISNVDAIYIVCGRTDMRKSIDGLCAIIQEQFSMEIDHSLYLFCGRKCDRIKDSPPKALTGGPGINQKSGISLGESSTG